MKGRRPRVLVIRYEGTPFHVRMSKVIEEILDAGWECDILIPENGLGKVNVALETGRDLAREVGIREFSMADHRLVRFARIPLFRDRFARPGFARALGPLVETGMYDLIWVKDSMFLATVFGCLDSAGPAGRIPVVCDAFENVPEQMEDVYHRFASPGMHVAASLLRLVERFRDVERRFLPRCDHVFVVVEENRDYMLSRYPLDPDRVSVVHNAERLRSFDRIGRGDLPVSGRPLITYVGGFEPHRGVDVLLDAIALLSRETGGPSFEAALVGVQPALAAEINGRCARRGIGHLVSVQGFGPHVLAMQWIKASTIGVVPHLDTGHIRNTIPNKLFQYMAAGVGCLVSDVGPLGRIVRETGCGAAFKAGDASDLARSIASALRDPSSWKDAGTRGRESAEGRYCWEIAAEPYRRYLKTARATA